MALAHFRFCGLLSLYALTSCGTTSEYVDEEPLPDGGGSDTGGASNGGGTGGSGAGGSSPDGGYVPPDEPWVPPSGAALGSINGAIRINHLGWRPGDTKVAVLRDLPSEAVELRARGESAALASFTSSAARTDEDSGDSYATVDFSSFTTPGSYYLYVPSRDQRSYDFEIAENVYEIVGMVAMKSFYYQRCNHSRVESHATDKLGRYPGIGGKWVDGACHAGDHQAAAGPGSANHGPLDVHGGWHDAGDYQKTLWGRGVPQMLWGYELNPTAWVDGQLNIPESGNGIPDILDELMWELDFYVRLQRPEGHFITSVKHNGSTSNSASPPSTCNGTRVYFDSTAPSGDGWSGGGTTTPRATANAVRSLAHAAIVLRSAGQNAIADRYANAARSGWAWLSSRDAGDAKCAAASAVYRLDPTQASAKAFVEGYSWSNWGGKLPHSATPSDEDLSDAAWHYLANSEGSETVKATIRQAVQSAILARGFSQVGAYGGMFGAAGNGWDYSWGSNRNASLYGANLLMAAHFGIVGNFSQQAVVVQAQKYFHYILGLNPLNMVYMTSMAAYGGEHSSFQIYHSWFSYTGSDGDKGNQSYNGKPPQVEEPLYPYHSGDPQQSTFGPAPGLLPGGPNFYYTGTYDIPNRDFPAYAYRDFSMACDWNNTQKICRAVSWEITEPMNAYQGPFVMLASFMMPKR